MPDGTVIDNDDVVEGIVQMRKGAEAEAVLRDIDAKVDFLNKHVLPQGVKIVPHIDRDDLVHLTTHTVLHNLTEGILLVVIVLFFFLGNVRSSLIVAITIPFSLFFASILLDLRAHSRQPALAGRARLRHDRRRRGGDGREHPAAAGATGHDIARQCRRDHSLRGARSAAAGVLRHRDHHHYLPADLHLAARRRPAVQAHGMDRGFCAAGRAGVLHPAGAGAGELHLPQRGEGVGKPGSRTGSTRATRPR